MHQCHEGAAALVLEVLEVGVHLLMHGNGHTECIFRSVSAAVHQSHEGAEALGFERI